MVQYRIGTKRDRRLHLSNQSRLAMPIFFFDVRTDDMSLTDDEGVALPDLGAVASYCTASLVEIAKSCLTTQTTQYITIAVRDQFNAEVAVRTIRLKCNFRIRN
jgi:hypothetical protein